MWNIWERRVLPIWLIFQGVIQTGGTQAIRRAIKINLLNNKNYCQLHLIHALLSFYTCSWKVVSRLNTVMNQSCLMTLKLAFDLQLLILHKTKGLDHRLHLIISNSKSSFKILKAFRVGLLQHINIFLEKDFPRPTHTVKATIWEPPGIIFALIFYRSRHIRFLELAFLKALRTGLIEKYM